MTQYMCVLDVDRVKVMIRICEDLFVQIWRFLCV